MSTLRISPKYNIFSVVIFLFCLQNRIQSQNIDLQISGIRSAQGRIQLQIYLDDKSFQDEVPFKTLYFEKRQLKGGELVVKMDLEPGTYGFALLDDENLDREMNYNFIGLPKEGFGFSNFYLSGMSKPHFNDFKFSLNPGKKIKVQMKIRYM